MSTAVTVLVPARDAAATVGLALRSTLRGLPAGSRVLVHDDASTDGTVAVVRALGDDRVAVVQSAEPRGVAGGLNVLLERVETPLVARMDADDVSMPWRFAVALRALRAGADATFTTVGRFGAGVRSLGLNAPARISEQAMPLHLLLGNPVAHATLVARTDALRAVSGYRAVPAEDYDLWLRLSAAGYRLRREGVAGLLSRSHPGQVTADQGWRARARTAPGFQDAYADLARRVLGAEPVWFGVLRRLEPAGTAEARTLLDGFAERLLRAGAGLPLDQRWLLRRRVAAVTAALLRG
ncbi:glycosyltransferase [Auraticoccus sp. F435]|uniref:Glycosyltransferase n=1 Tax=Auraticoccus cholistanensis TaxID=2656650 RepID=A0A6A9UUQ1_9ACTN|nr:glycosyltransferase [Auraticoccus cholistanensis]MVA75304.1 glycosyltransferase [Auraticoccus cholistanensis]